MHSLSCLLHCTDSALGRFDIRALSDQTLMELLISGFDEPIMQHFQDEDGAFREISDWANVECNADGTVSGIYFDFQHSPTHTCTLNLRYIPPNAKIFMLRMENVEGTMEIEGLPRDLDTLRISHSETICGSIDAAGLPRRLTYIDLENNALSGEVDFAALPSELCWLNLQLNKFSGSVDMRSLPRTLQVLIVACNHFSGELDLSRLPRSIESLELGPNDFSGILRAVNLPKGLSSINVGGCLKLDDKAVVEGSYEGALYYEGSGIYYLVNENGARWRKGT